MNKEIFVEEITKLGINLDNNQLENLERYYELLVEWNEKINLTSITNKEDVYLKHFYDSLTLVKAYNLNQDIKLCDVGTGAGFPGLVLKICFPNLEVILVDSLEKRIKFLDQVIQELDLKKINTYHDRVEEFSKNHREEYDLVTSRAVAKLNVLSEFCIPLVKIDGYFIPMKASIEEELDESKNSIKILGGELQEKITFSLPIENAIRNILKIRKINKTNIKYPRRFDKIKKNPL